MFLSPVGRILHDLSDSPAQTYGKGRDKSFLSFIIIIKASVVGTQLSYSDILPLGLATRSKQERNNRTAVTLRLVTDCFIFGNGNIFGYKT